LRVFSTSKNKQHAAIIAVEDIGFSVPIGFGTPPQMLNLVPSLDNGDTWVVDSKCVGRPDCPETCLQRREFFGFGDFMEYLLNCNVRIFGLQKSGMSVDCIF
jgi:hypothetical protein